MLLAIQILLKRLLIKMVSNRVVSGSGVLPWSHDKSILGIHSWEEEVQW